MNRKTILLIIILVLAAGSISGGYKFFILQEDLRQVQEILATRQINENVLKFAGVFIEKVLKAEMEVDFETRLKLENAIRDLDDKEILTQWQKFTESKTETEAQDNVQNLLEMLISKISI